MELRADRLQTTIGGILACIFVLGVSFALLRWCHVSDMFGSASMPRVLPASRGTMFLGLFIAPIVFVCSLIPMLVGTWRSARPLYSPLGFVVFAAGGTLVAFAIPPIGSGLDRLARMVAVLCLMGIAVLVEAGLRQSAHQLSWLLAGMAATCASAYAFWWGVVGSASV